MPPERPKTVDQSLDAEPTDSFSDDDHHVGRDVDWGC